MKILPPLFAIVLIFSASLRAASLERDLGRGLTYHRVVQIPADLPETKPANPHPRVLDLRYAHGDANAAAALLSWLKANASPRAPIFLLANPDTSPQLLRPFTGRMRGDGVLVIGPDAPGFQPDIAVKVSPQADRQAYRSLETQSDIESSLKENSDKIRNDEARLSKDRLTEPVVPEDPLLDDAGRPEEKGTPVKPVRPPIDAVLQRAWHLHRGLAALQKI